MLRYTVRWIQYVFLIANCFSRDTPHFEFRFRKACHVAVKIVAPSPRTNFKRTSRLLIRERDEKNGFVRECLGRNKGREGGLWSASNRVGKQFRRVLPRLQPSDYQWTPTCAGSITHVLHSSSLSLSLSFPAEPVSFHARGSFTKPSRRGGGGEAIEWQLRTIVRSETEETGGKASSAAPTRGNSRVEKSKKWKIAC